MCVARCGKKRGASSPRSSWWRAPTSASTSRSTQVREPQSKRLAARPSVAAIVGLIERIDVPADQLQALYHVGPGQRIASGHVFLLLREWVAEHGWTAPSGASFLASTEIVIELPVAVFREM